MTTADRPDPVPATWDDRRLAELMTRRARALRRVAERVLAEAEGAETADDVLQDAYLRARAHLAGLRRVDEAGVAAWLTRLVARLALDARRRRLRHRRLVERLTLVVGPATGGRADPAERVVTALADRQMLAAAAPVLARLPAGQRRALLLRSRLSVAETAALGCTPGAVRTRLARARAAFSQAPPSAVMTAPREASG